LRPCIRSTSKCACFDQLKRELEPDLVLTHYGEDRHQDHRLVSELTYDTFRDHLVLVYRS
jgi:LmbE family N-acetylglucosaminyl deacetylase